MSSPYSIKDFVRHTLGCTCPDKVFEQIEDRETVSPLSPHNRSITIGGRLLLYIWKVTETDNLRENLLAMLAAGRNERDERGLHRFRAILAVEEPLQQVAAEAKLLFMSYTELDDRMHLHVISADTFRKI
jgi:hypothetical protein